MELRLKSSYYPEERLDYNEQSKHIQKLLLETYKILNDDTFHIDPGGKPVGSDRITHDLLPDKKEKFTLRRN